MYCNTSSWHPALVVMANDSHTKDVSVDCADHPVTNNVPGDDRLHILDIDSLYCGVDEINTPTPLMHDYKYGALHLNIHSLPSKFGQLRNTIEILREDKVNIDFILLCETFLTNANADKFPIPGYNFVHKSRSSLSKGGVAMYISDQYNFIERHDLCINVEGEYESVIVEIEPRHGTKKILVSEIYRVPNTNERETVARYENMVSKMCDTHCDLVIGTDQNMDYMKVDSNTNVSDLLDVFITNGVLPTITRPTRITHTSATLIDNMYVKSNAYENVHSRILTSDMSDHFPVIVCMGKTKRTSRKEPLVFTHRPIGSEQVTKMRHELSNICWSEILHDEHVDRSYGIFIDKLRNVIDTCAPEKTTTIPHKSVIREPWMTSGIIRSSRKRDKLYRQSLGRIPDSVEKQKYLRYRNVYNSVKRQAKQFYYANLLQKYGGNVRKTWTVLNELIGRSKHKCAISDIFMIDGSKVEDKARISDEFCKYFSTVGETCANNIPNASKPYTHYMQGDSNMNSMFVRPTDKLEILKIIQNFKPKVSTGDDGISMQLLKHISSECSEPLSLLINVFEKWCFSKGNEISKSCAYI